MNYNVIVAKRKRATVLLKQCAKEQVTYNNKSITYFKQLAQYVELTGIKYISLMARGGGERAQLQAARLALAKYIVKTNPSWKPELETRLSTILTSDGRQRESKTAECRGARRRRQKSYR